jgi:hypothetical protein
MNWLKKLSVSCVSSAMASVPIAASFAQGAPAGYGHMINYVQAHDQCAALTWHFTRVENANKTVSISGPIWYEDGSGLSLAQGTGQADGHFTLNVKMMSGDGPVGAITGQRMPDGSVDATAVGPACFAGTFHIAPGQTSAKN